MKLHRSSVLQLHDLYHRKEGEQFVIGDPETGAHLAITAAELRVTRLLASGLELERVEELVREEKDAVDTRTFVHTLAKKGFIYTVDGKVVSHKREPLHELNIATRWIANPLVHYLLVLLALTGVFTVAWRGTIPGPGAFFFQDSLLLTILASILLFWVFIFLRELAKHGHARALGVQSRFGITNKYHWFLPKTYCAPATEEQQHRILASGLLVALAIPMGAAIIATFTGSPWWNFVFMLGALEILAECLLFLDTDLAQYIGFRSNIHALNQRTKELVIEDWKTLWRGENKPAHLRISSYAFLYLMSIVLAIIVLAAYIVPLAFGILAVSLERMDVTHPLFFDGAATLAFLIAELFLYGFTTLKRHPLAHNTFFVNISVSAIVLASFLAAALAVTWVSLAADLFLAALLLYALGMLFAFIFEHAMMLAHPFADMHSAYEIVVLPTIAACVPISVLFTVAGETPYFPAAVLALGMLSAIAILEMQRVATAIRVYRTQ